MCTEKAKNCLQNMTAERLRKAFFYRKYFFLFPCCSTRENLSNQVPITNVGVGLILTKLRWFIFSEYGQTDRHEFGILIWKHDGRQKISTQSSKLGVSCQSQGMHNYYVPNTSFGPIFLTLTTASTFLYIFHRLHIATVQIPFYSSSYHCFLNFLISTLTFLLYAQPTQLLHITSRALFKNFTYSCSSTKLTTILTPFWPRMYGPWLALHKFLTSSLSSPIFWTHPCYHLPLSFCLLQTDGPMLLPPFPTTAIKKFIFVLFN